MTLNYADRVVDVSSTTGTGNVTVSGTPPTGYRPLSDIALGQFEYVIENAGLTEWEVGIGTRLDAVTFSRDTVARSSNAGALVSFAAGPKAVTHSLTAEGITRAIGRIIGETPTGAINGSNATFLSAFNFIPESVEVVVNGLIQRVVTDYNTTGLTTVILTTAPLTGESIRLNYTRS